MVPVFAESSIRKDSHYSSLALSARPLDFSRENHRIPFARNFNFSSALARPTFDCQVPQALPLHPLVPHEPSFSPIYRLVPDRQKTKPKNPGPPKEKPKQLPNLKIQKNLKTPPKAKKNWRASFCFKLVGFTFYPNPNPSSNPTYT